MDFEDFDHFCRWYQSLNPNEELDKQEAMIIYFNLDTYLEGT